VHRILNPIKKRRR